MPVFCLNVNAQAVETKDIVVSQYYKFKVNGVSSSVQTSLEFYPNNSIVEKKETNDIAYSFSELSQNASYVSNYIVKYVDNITLFEKDKTYKVKLNQFYSSAYFVDTNNYSVGKYVRAPQVSIVILTHRDGTTTTVRNVTTTHKANASSFDIEFSVTPTKDVYAIQFEATTDISSNISGLPNSPYIITTYSGEHDGDGKYQFSLEVESQEAGLLKNIITWLENIWRDIENLPNAIWGLIEDGLTFLFVPTDNFLNEFTRAMDYLFEERLGAVYEVVGITFDSWEEVMNSDSTNTIEMPRTTINLPQNKTFTFGGFNVLVVPNGFEWLAETIKTGVAIVCTVMFVNGLRKRYDEIMH